MNYAANPMMVSVQQPVGGLMAPPPQQQQMGYMPQQMAFMQQQQKQQQAQPFQMQGPLPNQGLPGIVDASAFMQVRAQLGLGPPVNARGSYTGSSLGLGPGCQVLG